MQNLSNDYLRGKISLSSIVHSLYYSIIESHTFLHNIVLQKEWLKNASKTLITVAMLGNETNILENLIPS